MEPFDPNAYRRQVLRPLLDAPPDRLDPFTVFAIDEAEDDQQAIERRVSEVIAFWRREQSHARYRDVATRLLNERDVLAGAVRDPAQRAAAGASARAAREQARRVLQERFRDLVRRARRTHPHGVPRSRIERLRELARREGLDGPELDAVFGAVDVVDDLVEPLPAPERSRLRSTLAAHNQLLAGERPARTLFDVLGVDAHAPDEQVRAAAEALAARNRQRKHDRRRTVTDELLMLAGRHAVGPGRARYRATIEADVREQLGPRVEIIVLVEDRLGAADFEHLVREGVSLGLDPATARSTIIAVATQLGGAVETARAVDYLLCPACGAAEATGARRECRRCATPLHRPCPSCRREIEAAAYVCPYCRADLRAIAEAERECRERFAEAERLDGPERERALAALVADHPGFEPAVRMLASLPPAPPRHVEASWGPDSVLVQWRPSESAGVTGYRVTRYGADGRGRLVAQISALDLEDAGAPRGAALRYGVVAVRGERESAAAHAEVGAVAPPAPAGGPQSLPPVREVDVTDYPDHLLVRWAWPDGCTEAQVSWRGPAGDGMAKVTNMKYQLDGGYHLPVPDATAEGDWEISVAPGARLGRDLVWATPVDVFHHHRSGAATG